MKRSTFLLLGLLVAMMAIVYVIKRPGKVEEATYTVPDLKITFTPATIVKIEIEKDKKYVRLERIKNVWKITEPVRNSVDDEAMNQLLGAIGSFRITGLISTNAEKQSIFEVNELGTNLIVTNEDGTSASLVIGKGDPATQLNYVRPASSTSVYLAEGLTSDILNKDANAWRPRTIFKTDPASVQTIVLRRWDDTFSLSKRGDRWYSDETGVPTAMVNALLGQATYLRAEEFVDTALIINRQPELRLQIAGKDVAAMDFYPVDAARSRYFVKSSVNQNIYIVSRAIPAEAYRIANYIVPPTVAAEEPAPQQVIEEKKPRQIVEEKPKVPVSRQPIIVPKEKSQPVVRETSPPAEKPTAEPVVKPLVKTVTKAEPVQKPPERAVVKEVPPAGPAGSPSATAKALEDDGELTVYVVRKGETMEIVAQKFGVTVEDVKRWNSLKSAAVKPGRELYVYVAKK
jgi:LysM repeat protein